MTVGSGIADAPIAVRLHAPTFPLHRKLSQINPFQPVHQTTEPATELGENGANGVSEKIENSYTCEMLKLLPSELAPGLNFIK